MADLQTSEPLHIITVAQQDGSDWFNIETDGTPKRLKTMQEHFGMEAGRHRSSGALIRVKYSERHDKPNPHGGFYHDFYYSGSEVVESNGASAPEGVTRTAAPEHSRPTDPGDAWRICLSVGSERAVQSLQFLPPGQQDFPYQWALAYEWAARIYLTPPPKPDELEPIPTGRRAGAYDDPTEPRGDDDIPF